MNCELHLNISRKDVALFDRNGRTDEVIVGNQDTIVRACLAVEKLRSLIAEMEIARRVFSKAVDDFQNAYPGLRGALSHERGAKPASFEREPTNVDPEVRSTG